MHFHAEHSLFFERRRSLGWTASSCMLALFVLVLNAGMKSIMLSAIGACVASLLLVHAYIRGHRRMEPVIAWTILLVVAALLGGVALQGDFSHFAQTATRMLCGVLWILWLGTQLDWASLRQLLSVVRVPESIVSTLDHAVLSGMFTRREWAQRSDAARLRLGRFRLPLGALGAVISEGALEGFRRLELVEESALIRGACSTMSGGDQIVKLEAVDVERNGRVVLTDLSLQIAPGEQILLCGPSGAGKSSLFRLLAGLDVPLAGQISRFGDSITSQSKIATRLDGRVALLTQNPEHHFIASTVAEDIAWGLLGRGCRADDARRRATEMAASLGVGHLLDRPCHGLSFGEQRRVALAGLLVLEPTLLLLDEPTAGLDPVSAHALLKLIQELVQQTGVSCVWATHDLHALPPDANRIVLLRDGRIIFDGPTSEGVSSAWMQKAGLALPQEAGSEC